MATIQPRRPFYHQYYTTTQLILYPQPMFHRQAKINPSFFQTLECLLQIFKVLIMIRAQQSSKLYQGTSLHELTTRHLLKFSFLPFDFPKPH